MVDNKVGDKLFAEKKATTLLKQLLDIIEQLREIGIVHKTGTKLAYPRKGAADQIQTVHDLAVKYGLSVKSAPLDGMLRDVALSKQVRPFANALRGGLKLADDTINQADSEAWGAFLAYYNLLSALAEKDSEVAVEMASVIEFMSTGPRQEASNSGPTATPPSPTPQPTPVGGTTGTGAT
jgi:hypothetical protein